MRGLESLIPQKKNPYGEESMEKESVFMIEVDKIKPNPYQPRREFKEKELRSLADSIKVYGILQPLLVHKIEKEVPSGRAVEYELIAGERRLRAAQMVNLPRVPVIIRHGINNNQKLEVALIENVQRDDLNPLEEARAFKQLVDEFGMTHAAIGRQVSKSRPYVINTMRILRLPESMQEALVNGEINEGHTRPLLSLSADKEKQQKLFEEIKTQRFTVRQAEERGRQFSGRSQMDAGVVQAPSAGKSSVNKELIDLIDRFKNSHNLSRVNVKTQGRQAHLAIGFSTKKDLMTWLEGLIE